MLTEAISYLILSADPDFNALEFEPVVAAASSPALFIIIPSEIVSKTNGESPSVPEPLGINELVAGLNLVPPPGTTLVTNNDSPPF